MLERSMSGHGLAVLGSTLLITAGTALLLTFGVVFYTGREGGDLVTTTPLPAVGALIWLGAVSGVAASIVAIAVYDFRARWFWRCLVVAAVLWLLAAPIGSVIGLISLIVLLRLRKTFPHGSGHHGNAGVVFARK